jgi:hypothetical protein
MRANEDTTTHLSIRTPRGILLDPTLNMNTTMIVIVIVTVTVTVIMIMTMTTMVDEEEKAITHSDHARITTATRNMWTMLWRMKWTGPLASGRVVTWHDWRRLWLSKEDDGRRSGHRSEFQ